MLGVLLLYYYSGRILATPIYHGPFVKHQRKRSWVGGDAETADDEMNIEEEMYRMMMKWRKSLKVENEFYIVEVLALMDVLRYRAGLDIDFYIPPAA